MQQIGKPMFVHRWPNEHGKLYPAREIVFTKLLGAYERSLTVVLRHPAITLTILLLTIVPNIYLFVIVTKGFFPQQDKGTIQAGVNVVI